MGFFDFVGDAGEKIFGGSQIDEGAVREHLMGLGLAIRKLTVVADQLKKQVSVIGHVDTIDDKEKLLIAAGNVKGVEKVEDRIRVVEPAPAAPGAPATAPATAEAPEANEGSEGAEPPPDSEAPTSQFYTVASGDTLGAIASKFYGNAGKYTLIFEANRPMLSDPNKIYPGQMLRIPPQS